MFTIRKIALNILKINKSKKGGVKTKRLQAGWDDGYLEELLMQI